MTGTNPEFTVPVPMPLDDHTGPALRLPSDRSLAMVEAALRELDPWADAQPERAKPRAKMQHWQTWALTGGALLALAGSAAAARYYFHFGGPQRLAPSAPAPAQPARALGPVTEAPEPEADAPELAGSDDAPQLTAAGKAADKRAHGAGSPVRSAPEDLLQKANQQRAAGQFREAAQTYALVYDRFPKSLSAYVARVAGAAIELEHLSNPTRARKLFEQALRERPQGALDLEARQGLSLTLRDLEDRPAERRVLSALIAAHPDSPAARRAQVRLREIGAE